MTSPLGGGTVFRLGTGLVDVTANTTGLRRDLNSGIARETTGSKIVLPVELDRNFHRKIKTDLESALKNLPQINLNANSTPAQRAIERIRTELADLHSKDIGIDVDANVALQRITELRRQLNTLAANDPDIKVKAQTATASAELARIEQQAARIRDEKVKIDVETAFDRGLLKRTAANAGRDAGSSFGAAFSSGIPSLGGPVAAIAGLTAIAIPATAAVLALGSSLGLAASSAAALMPAMLGAATGVGAVMLAFSGVAAALKAHTSLTNQAASAATSGASQEAAAARRIQSAQDSLTDARRSQARAAADGAEQIRAAEDRLADAQERYRGTQEALTRARERAVEQIIELRDAAVDAALGEEAAQVALLRAKERQAKVSRDALSDDLDRREAALEVAQAQQRLTEATRDNEQAQKAANDANRKGVEGSDLVVEAKKDEQKAAKDVAAAQRELAKTQAEAAERQEQAAIQVARAVRDLADAQHQATVKAQGATAAANQYREALAKLSPAGRTFVETLLGMQSTFDRLKRTAETAVLPGFTSALLSVKTLAPDVERYISGIGSQIGRAASELGAFMASPMFRGQLKSIMGENEKAASSFADATVPLASALTSVSEAAAPLVSRFAEAFKRGAEMVAGWIEAKRESGELARFFKMAGDEIAKWWDIAKNITLGIVGLFVAANPAGRQLSSTLRDISERFKDWGTSQATRDRIQVFFTWLTSDETRQRVRDMAAGILAVGAALKALAIANGVMTFFANLNPVSLAIGAIVVAVGGLAFAFGYLYSHTETFRDGVNSLISVARDQLMPVFDRMRSLIMDKVVPVIRDVFARAFREIGMYLRDTFLPAVRSMYDNYLPKLEQAWGQISSAYEKNKEKLFTLFGWLLKVGGFFQSILLPLIGDVAGAIVGKLADGISAAITAAGLFVDAVHALGDAFLKTEKRVISITGRVSDLLGITSKIPGLKSALDDANRSLDGAARNVGELNTGALTGWLKDVRSEAKLTAVELDTLTNSIRKANGLSLSVIETNMQWEASIDAASDSLKRNGRTLDVHTDAGRANMESLLGIQRAAIDHTQAVYDNTYATKGATAAQKAAADQWEADRQQLIKNAEAMGMSAGQAKELADRIMGVPPSWNTKVSVDISGATRNIDDYGVKVQEGFGAATRKIQEHFGSATSATRNYVDTSASTTASGWSNMNQTTATSMDAMKNLITSMANLINGALRSAGTTRNNDLSTSMAGHKSIWSSSLDWINAQVQSFAPRIKSAFSGIGDHIGAVFRGIPRGIVGGLNAMLGMVDSVIDKINSFLPTRIPNLNANIKIPQGYATGGLILGPGTGTSDSVPIMASNGEYMIRAKAVSALQRAYGAGFLDQLNRYDVSGDPSALVARPRYADGGLITRTQDAIRGADPLPYVWGAVGPNAYDCSGLVGEVWARLTGHPSFRRYFTTHNVANGFGFRPGHGTFTIGLSDSHVVGNLAGLAFEAASSRSGIKVGGAAKSVDAMPRQYYLPEVGGQFVGGGGGRGGPSLSSLAGGIIDRAVSVIRGALPKPGGFMTPLVSGLFDKAIGGLKAMSFDQGGPLPPGPTLAVNSSGRTEQVLTAQQIDRLAQVANNAGITITKLEVHVRGILDPSDPTSYRRMVADIDEAITTYRKGYR